MRISINTANTQSQVISILRFPLVVLILFIHSNFHNISADWDVFWTINTTGIGPQVPSLGDVFDIISNSLATLANPFFFFISGSLFFKEGLFSKELYYISCNDVLSRYFYPTFYGLALISFFYL